MTASARRPWTPPCGCLSCASRRESEIRERALKALSMAGMQDSAERWASDLVWTERQLVQMARALVGEPKLLLLDEPASGMGIREIEKVEEIIRAIRDSGVTVVVVSHDVKMLMNLSDLVTVLNFGEKIAEGLPAGNPEEPAGPGGIPWRRMTPSSRSHGLSVSYGHINALKQASLEVFPGEIVVLIGANGAGKTTLLETVLGINTPLAGCDHLQRGGTSAGCTPTATSARACASCPEGRGVFASMTVLDNLLLGAHHNMRNVTRNLERVYRVVPDPARRARTRWRGR